nr:hypothetical protein [Angustibacter aerolatus]
MVTGGPALRRDEVDGVPTFWVPAEGPLRASLVFRTGQADEPLPRRGLTHLVEHLALHGRDSVRRPVNGSVSLLHTRFDVMGEPDEVAEPAHRRRGVARRAPARAPRPRGGGPARRGPAARHGGGRRPPAVALRGHRPGRRGVDGARPASGDAGRRAGARTRGVHARRRRAGAVGPATWRAAPAAARRPATAGARGGALPAAGPGGSRGPPRR